MRELPELLRIMAANALTAFAPNGIILHVLIHILFACYYPYFIDKETEVQRHSSNVLLQDLNPTLDEYSVVLTTIEDGVKVQQELLLM